MSIRDKLNSIAVESDLFPDLSIEEKETNRILAKLSATIFKGRKEFNMSQSDLADGLGVQQAMVSQWESGVYNFSIKTLVKILTYLKLKLDINIIRMSKGDEIKCINQYTQRVDKNQVGDIIEFNKAA